MYASKCRYRGGNCLNKRRLTQGSTPRIASALNTLMDALGGKSGFDPIPPSQYLFFLDATQPALQRLLAWVRSKTIRHRPRGDGSDGRSAFAVDDKGKALGLSDLARELRWKLPNASREWAAAEKLGLVRRDGRKLFLVGEVRKPTMANKRRIVICTDNLPKSILRQVKQWSEDLQQEFYAMYSAALEFGAALQAHQIARARFSSAEVEDTILARFGLARTHRPDRRELSPLKVPEQLSLFVDVDGSGAVQITLGAPGTDNKNAARTDNPILMEQRKTRGDTSASSTAVPGTGPQGTPSNGDDAVQILELAKLRPTAANLAYLRTLIDSGLPLEQIRAGVLVGVLRKATGPNPKERVHSLRYFEACIREAKEFPAGYVAHLQNKLTRSAKTE